MASWNPATGVWETATVSLCGHSAPYSETWPTSGTTRAGTAYARPTWALRTAGSASSSLLGTPRAQHGEDRNSAVWERDLSQPQNLENQLARLLPTPTASEGSGPAYGN